MKNDIKEILLTEEQIQSKVKELAQTLSRDYVGKNPVFVGVLKGVVIFFAIRSSLGVRYSAFSAKPAVMGVV